MRKILACLCLFAFAAAAQTARPAVGALPPEAAIMREAYRAGLVKIAGEYDASQGGQRFGGR